MSVFAVGYWHWRADVKEAMFTCEDQDYRTFASWSPLLKYRWRHLPPYLALTNLILNLYLYHWHTHTRLTALCPGLPRWAGSRKGKPSLDFTEARDTEWQWHQLGHMQVCTSLQTDNHASTPPLSFYGPDALPAAQPTASEHWSDYL